MNGYIDDIAGWNFASSSSIIPDSVLKGFSGIFQLPSNAHLNDPSVFRYFLESTNCHMAIPIILPSEVSDDSLITRIAFYYRRSALYSLRGSTSVFHYVPKNKPALKKRLLGIFYQRPYPPQRIVEY